LRSVASLSLWFLLACGNAAPQTVELSRPAVTADAPMLGGRRERTDSLDGSRRSAIVTAAERVAPATVSVNVTRRERRTSSLWDFFFVPREYERLVQGLGSGFIISADGLVLTNQHVTTGAEEIIVTTRDGRDYSATLLGEDPLTDIAVLKIDGRDLPVPPLGRSTDLMIGEWVVAIGNPYGYLLGNTEPTVTAGVVSAVGRNLLPGGREQSVYVGMIQTDAAINPGNSGGPLVNSLGEVVGVNASIFSESGGSEGIGFAIPIERALRTAEELRRHGEVRRAWIGLNVAGADKLREWKTKGGLEVLDVTPESPAAAAGLRAGDVLVRAGTQPLRTFLDWESVKLDVGPGDVLQIGFRRGGSDREARIRVTDLPTALAEKISVLGAVRVVTLTPAIRQERGVQSERGALIYEISEAAQRSTGLRPNDVIVRINRTAIERAEDVQAALRAVAGGAPVRVYFERGGAWGYTDFRVRGP
jgi:serine protease Do